MAIDFPASPSIGDQHTAGSIVWEYDGEKWVTLKSLFNRGILTAGTESEPGTIFNGDTDTGIYSPGSDQFGIATAGTSRVVIDSSGRVGVGTNTPSSLLSLSGASPKITLTSTSSNADSSIDATSSFGSLTISADENDEVASSQIVFNVDGSPKVSIKDTGNVGIGTTSPGSLLSLKPASGGGIEIQDTSGTLRASATLTGSPDVSAKIKTQNYHLDLETNQASGDRNIRFFTGTTTATQRAAIDGSGRLLVGTSSTSNVSTACFAGKSDGSDSAFVYLQTKNTAPADGNTIGTLAFNSTGNTGTNASAYIACQRDGGTWTNTSSMPGRLVFSTTADGASSPTERMRIRNDGTVLIGTTTTTNSSGIGATFEVQSAGRRSLRLGHNSSGNLFLASFHSAGGTVGTITADNTSTAYNTSSDYRLKENVVPLTGAADRLKQLKPSQFNFITDPSKTVDGFIAHEAQAVVPEAVHGTKDEVDDDGNPVYQGIDQSKLVPLLTAALQEALAKIETLEQRLNDAGIA